MIQDNAPSNADRKPLFPGGSCFPLSPDNSNSQKTTNGFPQTVNDQLAVIFNVIGSPNEEDVSFLTDQKALQYVKSFPPKERQDLKEKYPATSPEGIDLLQRLLVFNPFFRPTVQECLEHPYFMSVR